MIESSLPHQPPNTSISDTYLAATAPEACACSSRKPTSRFPARLQVATRARRDRTIIHSLQRAITMTIRLIMAGTVGGAVAALVWMLGVHGRDGVALQIAITTSAMLLLEARSAPRLPVWRAMMAGLGSGAAAWLTLRWLTG